MGDTKMKKLIPLCLLFLSSTVPPPLHPQTHGAPTPDKPTPVMAPVQPPAARPKLIIPPSDQALGKHMQAISGDLFFYPGVVIGKEGRWVGADNFLNIAKAIAIQVNFIKAEGVDISFTQEKFHSIIAAQFEKGGLTTNPESTDIKPPLPFFSLIIMIFPTTDGLAAACQGRLFEQVQVARVQLKDETFQAITWEQTNLVFGPTDEFEKMLTKTVDTLANNFVTRVTAHQNAK
jgi:hypothetical protein